MQAVRSHRANKTMKAAQLIDRSEDEDAADPTSSIVVRRTHTSSPSRAALSVAVPARSPQDPTL